MLTARFVYFYPFRGEKERKVEFCLLEILIWSWREFAFGVVPSNHHYGNFLQWLKCKVAGNLKGNIFYL